MAGEETSEKEEQLTKGSLDSWYEKIMNYLSERVSSFVAFLFFLFTVGAFFGLTVASKWPHLSPWIILVPAVLGLIAYYNRAFATIVFFLLVIFVII